MLWEETLKGEKDACYHKVKANSKDWPSAYASGRLVQCRKVGAANWGNSTKKSWEETIVKDWVSCSSCEDDKDGTEPCGRKDSSKGTKARCRPTCSACKTYKRRGGKPKKRKAGTFSAEEKEGIHGWFKRRG
mgnify:CR=1 FL=1